MGVAAVAILFYDYLLTIRLECDYVWHSRWTPVKALFFFARYSPFMDTAVGMLYRVSGNLDGGTCRSFMAVEAWVYGFAFQLTDIVLAIRTWAVYGQSRKVAALLLGLYACTLATVIYVTFTYVKSLTFAPDFEDSCIPSQGGAILIADWIVFAIVQGVCFILMARKAYQVFKREQGSTNLYHTVLQDGVVYYAVIFLLSLLNVVVVATQPEILDLLLTTPVRVIHSVVAGRIILHIRQVGAGGPGDAFTQPPATLSALVFLNRTAEVHGGVSQADEQGAQKVWTGAGAAETGRWADRRSHTGHSDSVDA
ncbi:hypothetical protein BV22DRAFT_345883 [Leucogyrophana mollusca]|uniref:Uncharacterized protein n=1 Tax=Leucogyrophana mollusca TaxID=85980 RepID=A0ACB8BL46_9AGAM|nr:hypothetical protein BV22DRAFT_345883 [Leucogyrophana mollusca]